MEKLSQEQKKIIIKKLEEKGAKLPCPRCGSKQFTLLDGYFIQPIQSPISRSFVIGGPAVPSIVTACNNCGFISQHAIGVLGLLPEGEKKNEQRK